MNLYSALFTAEIELAELEAQIIKKRECIAVLTFLIAVFSDLSDE